VRTIDIFLPDSEPDFWVFLDMSDFKDKRALLILQRNVGSRS